MKITLILLVILLFIGPLWVLSFGKIDFKADYRTANRKSVNIAPLPQNFSDAVILVYASRAFHWRGIFAVHTWIATKKKNAAHYQVYQVIGWRLHAGLPPLMIEKDIPDRSWFGNAPVTILDMRGTSAEKLIPQIESAAKKYPFPKEYEYWPGPNSNTFTAYVARQVPELGLALPSTAIGKDFLSAYRFFAKAPSGTGFQISFFGILGIMIAKKEGLEINFLGLVLGIKPLDFAIELPGVGEIKLN